MTDVERASFDNLILTCKPHHDLVDRIDPARFPTELLHKWKQDREGDNASALSQLEGVLTEERLGEILEEVYKANSPRREVEITLAGALFMDHHQVISVPMESWRSLLENNPRLADSRLAIAGTVRNIGYVPISVESCILDFIFPDRDGQVREATLIGSNDFPDINPRLPVTIGVGGPAVTWFTKLETLRRYLAAFHASNDVAIRVSSHLGSGEKVSSESYSISNLPLG